MNAAKTTTNYSADEAAVRDLFRALLDGRGRGDAFGPRFTEDADHVAFDGSHTRGREMGEVYDVRFLAGCRGRTHQHRDARQDRALAGARLDPDARRRSSGRGIVSHRTWLNDIRIRPMGRGFGAFLIWALSALLCKAFRLNK